MHYDGEREDGTGVRHLRRPIGALSMECVLGIFREEARVDYLMDIEGVEARLLSGTAAEWISRVDAISLQVHDPYTTADCERDLAALGFVTR